MPIPVPPVLDPCTIAFVASAFSTAYNAVKSAIPGGLDGELTGAALGHVLGGKLLSLRDNLKLAPPDANYDLQNALNGAFWSSLLYAVDSYGIRAGRPMDAFEKWGAPSWVSSFWQAARGLATSGALEGGKAPLPAGTAAELLPALYTALYEKISGAAAAAAPDDAISRAYAEFEKLLERKPTEPQWLEALELGAVEHLRKLAPAGPPVPDALAAEVRASFRPLFRAAFARAIKAKPEVERIANAVLLAEIHVGVGEVKNLVVSLDGKIEALRQELRLPFRPRSEEPPSVDEYIQWIRKESGVIDLGALRIKADKVTVPIDDLWVPAETLLPSEEGAGKAAGPQQQERLQQPMRLEEAVNRHRFLAIQGEAGTGKSTFVKRIVFELCRDTPAREPLRLEFRGMPLWLTVKNLENFVRESPRGGAWPTATDDPAWIPLALGASRANTVARLDLDWFAARLADSGTILLLDGLDEAAADWRAPLAKMFLDAHGFFRCRMVVTMRPEAEQSAKLLGDTRRFEILPMERTAVDRFIALWTSQAGTDAEAHAARLRWNLDAKPAIRKMAGNPLMLTVLAVLTSNGQDLPEERAALLGEIVVWLAKSRLKDDRKRVDKLLRDLGDLALKMVTQTGDNKYAVGFGTAASWLADCQNPKHPDPIAARQFLDEAEVDTGLISNRGGKLVFWHRLFQEYLAARRLANVTETQRHKSAAELLAGRQSPEVLRLLAGHMAPEQGELLDALFLHLIAEGAKAKKLEPRAYSTGVLAGMRQDLEPTGYLKENFVPNVEPDYRALVKTVERIFDPDEAGKISIPDRLAAAEALAAAGGDTRLVLPVARLDKRHREYWVRVEGGKFLMGAQAKKPGEPGYDAEAHEDEGPPRWETVPGFWLGRYPVTVYEYQRYLEDINREPSAEWKKATKWEEQIEHQSRPVVRLTWQEAADYCEWAGGMLPQETQWEFAARGPGEAPRRFPWGNDAPTAEHANWDPSGVKSPSPVGSFPLGDAKVDGRRISDVAGNVWEWTSSKYGTTSNYVPRGGSFLSVGAGYLRAAYRSDIQPDVRGDGIGFRCAREVSP